MIPQTRKSERRKAFTYNLRNSLYSYLFGHLFHHILEHPGILEGLVDLVALVAPADHSHLVPLSDSQHSQEGLEARVLLTTGRRQKCSVKDKGVYWIPENLKKVI